MKLVEFLFVMVTLLYSLSAYAQKKDVDYLSPIINFLLDDENIIPPTSDCMDTGDDDNDRILNCYETNTGVFEGVEDTGTDPNNKDTDGDGISDGDEVFGTVLGLNLPAMGVSPLKKNILLEYDWFDDSNDCSAHTHRPTAAQINRFTSAFANAPVDNPDGTTGVTVINDYGQGGVFNGGNFINDADGVLIGGVGESEFLNYKAVHFDTNRLGYFHYVILPHRYNTSSWSSGQAEIWGDDMIVSLQCSVNSTSDVANTIMHELGHNLNLLHGGNTHCNNKPNYNSIMNYRYQFTGVDTDCNVLPDGVLNYSMGTNISLNENNLNENNGVCGVPNVFDWNDNNIIESSVRMDINSSDDNQVDNCGGVFTTHNDFNDWSNIVFSGINREAGAKLLSPIEIVSCSNSPHVSHRHAPLFRFK